MKKFLDFCTLVCAAASVILLLLTVILLIKTETPILWSQEAAGWVQAIGSVVAIAIAIGLSQLQSRNAKRLMIEADLRLLRRRIDSFKGIINSAATQMQDVADNLKGTKIREICNSPPNITNFDDKMYMTMALDNMQGKHPFMQTLALIDSIPLYDLGSSELVEAVRNLKNAIQTFANHIEHALTQGEGNYNHSSLWNSASIWPCLASEASNKFDEAAIKISTINDL